jgi:Zn-dependent protease
MSQQGLSVDRLKHDASFGQTPILDSGVLPLRSSQDPTVMPVVSAIGFGLVIIVPQLASRSSKTGIIFPLVYVALFFAILIHELGHLTAGWYVGFRFRYVSVWRFALRLEHGSLKLRFLRQLIASGIAGMETDSVVRLRRRLLLFVLGGPTANLITAPIAVLFAHAFLGTTHSLLLSLAYQLAMISILSAVLNLLPLPIGLGFTDGSRIAMLLRDRERSRRLLSIYAVEAQRRNGILPANWRQKWLKAASSVSDESTDAFWGNWLAYTSCIARDDCESGAVHLERCLQVSCSLPSAMRDFAAQQAAYFAGRFRSDTALALKWVKQTGRWDLRKIRFAEPPRKVQLPLSPRPLNKWSEWT